ncbi:MAG: hypothetical protein WD669_11295 [Pirellulales bacterium]
MDVPLAKYIVLVPLCTNNGAPVASEILVDFQDEMLRLGGGYTIAGTVEGAYRMADGTTKIDHSLQYWICVPATAVEELTSIVARLGALLGQESMYMEITGGVVALIPPKQVET